MKFTERNDIVTSIESRRDLDAFIDALRHDLAVNPLSWVNLSLDDYLDALGAEPNSSDESFARFGEQMLLPPSWRLGGKMLLAAKYYE